MAINFASARPGIDLFNANVARGDQQRRQEEQDFMRRMEYEKAQGVDAAQRSGTLPFLTRPQAAPVQTTQFQPTPAPVPNPALTTPVVSPDQSMNPADNPDYGGPTRAAPMPNAVPGLGAGVPATVPGQPAIASVTAQPPSMRAQPGTSSRDGYAEMASTFAKTPGMGSTMMGMVNARMTSDRAASVEERKQKFEAEKLVYEHITKGDWRVAKSVNDQYRLGIPDEVFQHRGAQQLMTLGARMADLMGEKVKGATIEHKMAYMQGFAENMAQTNDEAQAHSAGMKAAQAAKPEFQATHFDHSPSGEVMAFDKSGAVKRTGAMARQPANASGGAGGMSKQQQFTDYKIKLYTERLHLDDETAVKLATNPRMLVTPQDIMRVENNLRRMTNMGRPLYKTEAEVRAVARSSITAAQRDAGGGAGAPTAGMEGAATAGPANDPLGIRAR